MCSVWVRLRAGRDVVKRTGEAGPGLAGRMRSFVLLNPEKPLSDFKP